MPVLPLVGSMTVPPGLSLPSRSAAFDRHAVGHDQDQPIALDRGDHGEADAGVAAGRLDDGAAGLQAAVGLGRLDHSEADAVLDRAAGVGALALHPHLVVGEQAGEADVRGVADGGEDVVGLHGAGSFA